MAAQFAIRGLDGVLRKMRGLAPDLRAKGAKTAMRKAARVVANNVKKRAKQIDDPSTAENISKNVAVKLNSRESKATGDVVYGVGILGGATQYGQTKANRRSQRAGKEYATAGSKGNPGGDTWYWRMIEFGTEKMKAEPFMRPAMSESIEVATTTAVEELDTAITKFVQS